MNRKILILALTITRRLQVTLAIAVAAACSSEPDLETVLRESCHELVDAMATADGSCALDQFQLRSMRAQCDLALAPLDACTDSYLDYVYCLSDQVWVCKPEFPAPLPADSEACANEKAFYERCVRTNR